MQTFQSIYTPHPTRLVSPSQICPQCGRTFSITGNHAVYRACDAYVCSPMCSDKRVKRVASVDRDFSNPSSWQMKRTKSVIDMGYRPLSAPTIMNTPAILGLEGSYDEEPEYSEEHPIFLKDVDDHTTPTHTHKQSKRRFDDENDGRGCLFPVGLLLMMAVATLFML